MVKLKTKQSRSRDPKKFRGKLAQMRLNDTEYKAIKKYINKHHPKTSISQVLRHIIFETIELPTPSDKVP